MRLLKTVIHAHTNYSHDSNVSPAELVATARRQGVDRVAVTDHDCIAGALEARAIGGDLVIIGEEVSTADGHMIGLFLRDIVPPGLSGEETAGRIHAQGGVVLVPHPFARLCDESVSEAALARLVSVVDAIEVNNAQNVFVWEEVRARQLAAEHGITPYVGADAHVRGYLAACYQLVPDFDGAAGFVRALREAELHAGRFGAGYFVQMGARHAWEQVFRGQLPGFGVNAPDRVGERVARRPT